MNLRHAWVVAMILRHACGRSEAGHSGAVGVLQPNLCDCVEQSKFWVGLGDLGTRRLLFYGRQLPSMVVVPLLSVLWSSSDWSGYGSASMVVTWPCCINVHAHFLRPVKNARKHFLAIRERLGMCVRVIS